MTAVTDAGAAVEARLDWNGRK